MATEYRTVRIPEALYETLVKVAWTRRQMGDAVNTVEMVAEEALGNTKWHPDPEMESEQYEQWQNLTYEQWSAVREKVMARHGYLRGYNTTR